ESVMVDTRWMTGKTVLVTGGTGGIGKATAVGLAGLGARGGLTGRDPGRAEAAAADIRAVSGNPAVDVFTADLSSQAQVRRLAGEVLDAYPRLDVLVNNVGGFWAHRHVTADGLEHTFALNHLAPFLLTHLLLDRLKASAPARGVTVSSRAHTPARTDFAAPQGSAPSLGPAPPPPRRWPTSCSPKSWPAAWTAPASPPPCCTRAWCAPTSAPKTRPASRRSCRC